MVHAISSLNKLMCLPVRVQIELENYSESLYLLAANVVADWSQLIPLNFQIAVAPQQKNHLLNLNESAAAAAVVVVNVVVELAWPFVSLSYLCRMYCKSVACGLDLFEIG